jgi:hypothetical protein
MRLRRRSVVDGRRPAREDQSPGRFAVDCFDGRVIRKNLAVNTRFSDATSDELRVLRSEVKYYYGFMILDFAHLERVADYSHGLHGFKTGC